MLFCFRFAANVDLRKGVDYAETKTESLFPFQQHGLTERNPLDFSLRALSCMCLKPRVTNLSQ